MIKFIHKKHMHTERGFGNIIIYYNLSDIILGSALLALVIFFINNYLSNSLPSNAFQDQVYRNQLIETSPTRSY